MFSRFQLGALLENIHPKPDLNVMSPNPSVDMVVNVQWKPVTQL